MDFQSTESMSLNQALYGICTLLTGLLAGVFYGYQCSVINGLGRLGSREYLLAFKSINVAILNPIFFLVFLGSLIFLILSTLVMYRAGNTDLLIYLLVATAIYAFAVFGVTAICNVPLNDSLASFDIQSATSSEIKQMRLTFEAKWNKWHLIRTIASVMSFITLLVPLVKRV